MVQDRM